MFAVPVMTTVLVPIAVEIAFEQVAVNVSPSEKVTVKVIVCPLVVLPFTVIDVDAPNTDVGVIVPVPVRVKLLKLPEPFPLNVYENGVVV